MKTTELPRVQSLAHCGHRCVKQPARLARVDPHIVAFGLHDIDLIVLDSTQTVARRKPQVAVGASDRPSETADDESGFVADDKRR